MSDRPRVPRALRPRWKVERRVSALLALGALGPGCAGRSYDGEMPIDPPPSEYSPASDPVNEPAMYRVLPEFTIETAWLNGRQLVVHVMWKPTAESTRGGEPLPVTQMAAVPIFAVTGVAAEATSGTVPHLAPSPPSEPPPAPSSEPAPEPPPAGQAVKATIVTEPVGKEPGHYWFLARGLAQTAPSEGKRWVAAHIAFETPEGPFQLLLHLEFTELGGAVKVLKPTQ